MYFYTLIKRIKLYSDKKLEPAKAKLKNIEVRPQFLINFLEWDNQNGGLFHWVNGFLGSFLLLLITIKKLTIIFYTECFISHAADKLMIALILLFAIARLGIILSAMRHETVVKNFKTMPVIFLVAASTAIIHQEVIVKETHSSGVPSKITLPIKSKHGLGDKQNAKKSSRDANE